MHLSSLLLTLLALVSSLDFGSSFANAKKSAPAISSTTSPIPRSVPASSPLAFARPRATLATSTMSLRQRPAASATNKKSQEENTALKVSAGGAADASNNDTWKKGSVFLTSLWGSGGVIYILAKAIKRVVPIALEPFQGQGVVPLSQLQLGIYITTCLWFAYVEGYKGFQKKFSPLVVRRSLTLQPGKSGIHHMLLAPLYSMGLFHATKKRKIVSWSVTIGVAAIVAAVKRMPYPWRNIIDAGVVAGLTWGSLSIVVIYLKAWFTGQPPAMDPAMPEE